MRVKIGPIIIGAVACLVLSSNVYAANKTHITDTLGAGNSKMDIGFGINGGTGKSSILFSGSSTTLNIDSKVSGYTLSAGYSLGITDRLDVSVSAPLFVKQKSTTELPSNTTTSVKTEGQGDVTLSAQYLVLEKQQDKISWLVRGVISPSTAPADEGVAEVTVNGTVTLQGKTAKPGRGYTRTGFATALAIPTSIGDAVFAASYDGGGERTSSGITRKYGDTKAFNLYLESMINERTTLTPCIGYSMFGAGTYGAQNVPSNSSYSLGIGLTHDVSKAFSIQANTIYSIQKETTYTNIYGSKITTSGNSYGLSLSTLFFF
ncbi:MAG TPA: hypothetical protein VK149_06325 [Sideroxyarcus sp.]|nr:hypothetical protein [Sideroxyarcus sp.]